MTRSWKQLQGQIVEGKLPLAKYLGGSEHSAVFLTEWPQGQLRKVAIKLIPAGVEEPEAQLSRWAQAQRLTHAHLVRLFEMGRTRLNGQPWLYAVMEYAEEDLSQVVAERALTPEECQEMLPTVIEALAYIHQRGLAHGHLKPANIMASGDQVKLSSDGLCRPGDKSCFPSQASVYDPPEAAREGFSAAGDVWSLGMTLVEVLTRKLPVLEAGRREPVLPASIPAPLADVVRHCLHVDPKQRWTLSEITARLKTAPSVVPQVRAEAKEKTAAGNKRRLAVALGAAIIAAVIIGLMYSRPGKRTAPAGARETAAETRPGPPAKGTNAGAPNAAHTAIVREVLPKASPSARNTIRGTIRVRILVALDDNGNVAGASFDSPGPSQYFARLAMQAAQSWKFSPPRPQGPNTAKNWLLRFEFRRESTRVVPTPLGQ